MELSFTTLDVFTDTRFQGNPLALVSVPPQVKGLSQGLCQKIAAEFNLSETVILHESEDVNSTERKVNIHTIEREVPFAGHPTIGAAFFLRHHLNLSIDTLSTNAGPISISSVRGMDGHVRAKIPHNVHVHSKTLGDALGSKLAGLSPIQAIREAELRAPVVSVVKGMTFILVELPSLELLAQVQKAPLDFDHLPSPLLDEAWRPSLVVRYFYVKLESSVAKQAVRARMVELSFEDPATGSAACALASYLTLTEFQEGCYLEITQGVEMGRRSVITVQTVGGKDVNGDNKIDELWLGGTAVVVSKGTLFISIHRQRQPCIVVD